MAVKKEKKEAVPQKTKKTIPESKIKVFPRIQTAEGWKRSQMLLRNSKRMTHKAKGSKTSKA